MNALGGDLATPMLVLKQDDVTHNIALMARYCTEHEVSLAPHAKTTMAPQIIRQQLQAGAWGITVANVQQAIALRDIAAPRVLIANELADPASLRTLVELGQSEKTRYLCLINSEPALRLLESALTMSFAATQAVLLEIGVDGGRAGLRDDAEAIRLAERIASSPAVHLAGLETFEGVLAGDDSVATVRAVDELMGRMSRLALELDRRGAFGEVDEVILSAGGSAYFDRVVAGLATVKLSRPVRLVLRSGCYVTHDCGLYQRTSPFGLRIKGEPLRNALELWASVVSRPEAHLAILNFGKRDVAYDIDLPVPLRLRRWGSAPRDWKGGEVVALNDQHAIMKLDDPTIAVGDWLCFGVSHPCTAFDKWRAIPVVSEAYELIATAETRF